MIRLVASSSTRALSRVPRKPLSSWASPSSSRLLSTTASVRRGASSSLYATSQWNVSAVQATVVATPTSNSASFSLFTSSHRTFASLPDHTVLSMPALSPTMEKGNIASWKVKVGDKVKPGTVMAEVETDKATVAFESVETGVIAKILLPAGSQDVAVGTPAAILVENDSDVKAFESYSAGGSAAAAAPKPAAAAAAAPKAAPAASSAPAAAAAPAASSAGGRIIASPAAKRVANEQGVALENISGTGPNNRILQADVLEQGASAKSRAAAPAAGAHVSAAAMTPPSHGVFEDIQLTNMRKIIANRLSYSKSTIPHYYLSVDINMENINKLRNEFNAQFEKAAGPKATPDQITKLSFNDFVVKAAALACKKVPAVNSSWQDSYIRQFNYVDMCIAVSTPAGLMTPFVKDADVKGLATISNEVKSLASRARDNKLTPPEYQGGTFTISNLGMFGIKNFSAIINPPQSAILAVGTTEQRVIPGKDAASAPVTATFMNVTLSCDHRTVDGAVGAQWLQSFKAFMEKPNSMLL